MGLAAALFEVERELAEGDGDTYRRHLTDEATVRRAG